MAVQPDTRPGLPRRAVLMGGLLAAPSILRASTRMIRVGGTGAALGGMKLLGEMLLTQGSGPGVTLVPDLGTIGGIRGVAAGMLDLSVAARPPNAEEIAQGLMGRHYASTPLVFATHAETGVSHISHDDAVAMIGGTRRSWPDDTPVRVSRRPERDGDTRILAELSPAMKTAVAALMRRPGLATASSDHDQAAALESARGSFGVIALSLLRTERRPLTVLPLDACAPDAPEWPMHKPLHAVSRAVASPTVQAFLDHLAGAQAAALLSPLGHSMPARA